MAWNKNLFSQLLYQPVEEMPSVHNTLGIMYDGRYIPMTKYI